MLEPFGKHNVHRIGQIESQLVGGQLVGEPVHHRQTVRSSQNYCVCPGITADTGVWRNVSADYVKTMHLPMDEVVKKFTAKVPMGRLAEVEDVVAVTVFLASKGADYMTGQAINITGGREMH